VGFLKSGDNGRTWQRFTAPLAGKPIVDFTVSADGLSIAAMVRDSNAVYTSADGGNSWTRISISVNGVLQFHPQSADTIFVTAQNELYKSDDGIKTGNLSAPNYKRVGTFSHWIEKIVIAPSNPRIMYVSTRGLRVYKSADGGETFSLVVKLREVMADSIYITNDTLTLGQDTVVSVSTGDTTTVSFACNTTWVVSNPTNWIVVAPLSGSGNQQISITTQQNLGAARTAVLKITAGVISKTILVKQHPIPPILLLSEDSLISGSGGDTASILLTSNTNWTVDNPVGWISITPMNGSGNDTLTFVTQQNAGGERSATVTLTAGILTKTLYVKQETLAPILNIGMDSLRSSVDGDTTAIQLTSNTSWIVSGVASWIKISPLSGNGDTLLELITEKNMGGLRTATINISGGSISKTIYVEQPMITSSLTLEKDTILHKTDGDTLFVQLTSNTSWTLGTSTGWVIVSPMSGMGNQLLSILTTKNIGAIRTAIITITAGSIVKTIYVKQETSIPFITIGSSLINSPAAAFSTTVTLSSNSNWTVNNPVSWLSVTPMSGNGNAIISCIISENRLSVAREAMITIKLLGGGAAEVFTVHQEGMPTTGLSNIISSSQFTLHPNPTVGKLTFKNNLSVVSTIQVFDISGRLVDQFMTKGEEEMLRDYADWNNGLYMLTITSNEGVRTMRIVIQR
jgi:hypothetical protein